MMNREANKLVDVIDSGTIIYYSQLLEKVKQLDSAQLEKQNFSDKLAILKIRHLLKGQDLLSMDGKMLLATLVTNSLSGHGNISNETLGEITEKNDSAWAEIMSRGIKTPRRYLFLNELGNWKIRMNSRSSLTYKQLFPENQVSENEFITGLLESLSHRKVTNQIWHPIE